MNYRELIYKLKKLRGEAVELIEVREFISNSGEIFDEYCKAKFI